MGAWEWEKMREADCYIQWVREELPTTRTPCRLFRLRRSPILWSRSRYLQNVEVQMSPNILDYPCRPPPLLHILDIGLGQWNSRRLRWQIFSHIRNSVHWNHRVGVCRAWQPRCSEGLEDWDKQVVGVGMSQKCWIGRRERSTPKKSINYMNPTKTYLVDDIKTDRTGRLVNVWMENL